MLVHFIYLLPTKFDKVPVLFHNKQLAVGQRGQSGSGAVVVRVKETRVTGIQPESV